MQAKALSAKWKHALLGATNLNPADFPLGSPESRAVARHLVEQANSAEELGEYDSDCMTLADATVHFNARMDPNYSEVESTAVYSRGAQLLRERHPVIPAHLDKHLRRSTTASLYFELFSGREPIAGDVLSFEAIEFLFGAEMRQLQYGFIIAAWERQLKPLPCPLKLDSGRLFRRLNPKFNNGVEWEEATDEYPEAQWHHVEWGLLPDRGVSGIVPHTTAVVFLGLVDGEHRCRPATAEEINQNGGGILIGGALGEILQSAEARRAALSSGEGTTPDAVEGRPA
jgi:hypothetical protein